MTCRGKELLGTKIMVVGAKGVSSDLINLSDGFSSNQRMASICSVQEPEGISRRSRTKVTPIQA